MFNMVANLIGNRSSKQCTLLLFYCVASLLMSISLCAKIQIQSRDTSGEQAAPVSNPQPAAVSSSSGSNGEVQGEKNKSQNCSTIDANRTECQFNDGERSYMDSVLHNMSENKGALLRTLYVTLGLTGVVVAYFIVRGVLLRRRRTKSRKYGIIAQHGDRGDMEMEPLGDGDDDDDDYTVFELNGTERKK